MSKYSTFVEWASLKSSRPALVALLIHVATVLIVVILCTGLYFQGWLFETLLLVALLAALGSASYLFYRRMRNDVVMPPSVGKDPMSKPEPYDERYHVKGFLKQVTPVSGVAILTVLLIVLTILGVIPSMFGFSATMSAVLVTTVVLFGGLVLLLSAFFFYQKWWKWNSWRIIGDPETGQIGFTQPDSPRWLFVIGSSTDYFNLDEYTIYTPNKSSIEFLLFKRSQMLGLLQGNVANASLTRKDFKKEGGPPYHEDIKDVDRLIAIQSYWRGLARQEEAHSRSTVDLLEELVELSKAQRSQNGTIIRLLAMLAHEKVSNAELRGDIVPHLDDTQVLDP